MLQAAGLELHVAPEVGLEGGEVGGIPLRQGLDGAPLSALCPSPLRPVAPPGAVGCCVPLLYLSQLEKGGEKRRDVAETEQRDLRPALLNLIKLNYTARVGRVPYQPLCPHGQPAVGQDARRSWGGGGKGEVRNRAMYPLRGRGGQKTGCSCRRTPGPQHTWP